MARQWQNNASSPRGNGNAWYNQQRRIYEGTYARTGAQGRTSRRIHDGFSVMVNYGLDTDNDQAESSIMASPYYLNGRHMSYREYDQKAGLSSRDGSVLESIKDEQWVSYNLPEVSKRRWIKLAQGMSIKFKLPIDSSKLVVGNMLTIKNTGKSRGQLRIYIEDDDAISKAERQADTEEAREKLRLKGMLCSDLDPSCCPCDPVRHDRYETSTDLSCVTSKPTDIYLHSSTPLTGKRGYVWVRMEIYDDICDNHLDYDDDTSGDEFIDQSEPFYTDRYIEILGEEGEHYFALYTLPNTDEALEEQPYRWEHSNGGTLLSGFSFAPWKPLPVYKIANEHNGASYYLDGHRYDLVAGDNIADQGGNVTKQLFIYDTDNHAWVSHEPIILSDECEAVYTGQDSNHIYFVDGGSPLRKISMIDWSVSDVVSSDPQMTAPVGAKILVKFNNRFYLSNFPGNGNLSMMSLISADTGADYASYPYRWYTPNEHQTETSYMPITAVLPFTSSSLMYLTKETSTIYATSDDPETTIPSQLDYFGIGYGVESQGDITNYNGHIYSFNYSEGIRQFNGSEWRKVPSNVDRLLRRVDMNETRHMFGYANKVYFSYVDEKDMSDYVLVYDLDMNYQQYPFFRDNNIDFIDARPDTKFNILATPRRYLGINWIYKEDTYKDLDTPICLERHTKYIRVPGWYNDFILRRAWWEILADHTASWFLGMSFEDPGTDNNTDGRNNIHLWRKVVFNSFEKPDNAEDIMDNKDFERAALRRQAIHINHRATSVQFRVKTWTFNHRANMVAILPEFQAINLL